jgi:parvulin-like peptidyl-prolyl isomerase
MFRRNLTWLCCVLAALCCAAHAQEDKSAAPFSKPATAERESDLVVARVAGEPITEKQVLTAISLVARQKPLPPDRLKDRNTLLFKDALDSLITVAILKGEVKQRNIAVDPAKVDQQMQQISKQFPSREEFLKAMEGQGVTEAQLRNSIEDRMNLQLLMDQAAGNVPPATEEEIAAFYAENAGRFTTPEQVRASHILLTVDAKSTPEQKAEIKKKLEGIRAEIESKAITFDAAAAKYSLDPSNATKGGDLGLFPRGRMVKPFEDAAFAATPGTVSSVIESPFGYHILLVTERKPAGKQSLEEAKPSIRQFLHQLAKQKAFQKYAEELRAKTAIETYMTAEEFARRHP